MWEEFLHRTSVSFIRFRETQAYATTQTIDTYVYNALMKLGNIFMSSAVSVLQSVVGFVPVMCANAIVRKYEILPEQYSGVTD